MNDVLYFFSKSANCLACKGTNEHGDPANYMELNKYEFRKILSNFYEYPMKINGYTYLTVEHYYQGNKFAINNPLFTYQFTLESNSNISKDPILAKSAGDKSGKNKNTILRPSNIIIDPNFFEVHHTNVMKTALHAKFSLEGLPKYILINTKQAELWHGTRGVPPTRQYLLEEIRLNINVINIETIIDLLPNESQGWKFDDDVILYLHYLLNNVHKNILYKQFLNKFCLYCIQNFNKNRYVKLNDIKNIKFY